MRRRDILKLAPLASVAVMVPATAKAIEPDLDEDLVRTTDAREPVIRPAGLKSSAQIEVEFIDRLIEAHQQAWLAFEASISPADRLDPAFEGEAAIERKDRLDELEQQTLHDLLSQPTTTLAASNRKATYLLTSVADPYGRWEPDAETMISVLRSLLGSGAHG